MQNYKITSKIHYKSTYSIGKNIIFITIPANLCGQDMV